MSGIVPGSTSTTTYYRQFSQAFTLSEGENTLVASGQQPYKPFLSAQEQVSGFVDTLAPLVSLSGIPASTNELGQTLTGIVVDNTLASIEVTQTVTDAGTGATSTQTIFAAGSVENDTFTVGVSLREGTNVFDATAIDGGGKTGTATLSVIGAVTAPTAQVGVVGITSAGEVLVGDQFFTVVVASDNLSGVASVTDSNGGALVPISQVLAILVEMHGLGTVGGATTTHVQLSTVQSGTPVGANTITLTATDGGGNAATVSGTLQVNAERGNRNFFLFPGFNFQGLALIPDDGNTATTDDSKLDRLMTQDITTRVNSGLTTALGGTVTLGDVIESTFAFNDQGNFIVHTPGTGAADTLTDLTPFQGMITKTRDTVTASTTEDVFKKVSVAGFTAKQAVPIRVNIEGVFFRQGELPPDDVLRVGYNLVAPHALDDSLFDLVYRGALIPRQLAVSALAFERRVDASASGSSITAEIFEGFVANSLGDLLKPALSYWTFIASDDPLNPTRPTITP